MTVSDFLPEEIKKKITISTALIPCEHQGCKINVLDTPGYADFYYEVVGALKVVDSMLLMFSATAGVEVQTQVIWEENPDLPKGEVRQVDWGVDGADVTIHRQVYRDGKMIIEDAFQTHYQPWQAVFEYGPGTEGMPPEENQEDEKEVIRKEVVKKVIGILENQGFVVDNPKIKDNIVFITSKTPSGKVALFQIHDDNMMHFDFEGYEGTTCKDQLDAILQKLSTEEEVETGIEQFVWKNPDRIKKGAKDAPYSPARYMSAHK